jgi:hypothetical protein
MGMGAYEMGLTGMIFSAIAIAAAASREVVEVRM